MLKFAVEKKGGLMSPMEDVGSKDLYDQDPRYNMVQMAPPLSTHDPRSSVLNIFPLLVFLF